MIWVALGLGAAASVVSVLCGAGGASTAHPPVDSTSNNITDSSALALRPLPELTSSSVSTRRRTDRSRLLSLGPRPVAAAGGGIEFGLAYPHDLRSDLDAFVLGAELHG